ncbi:phosphoserine phosphatase SerB [Rhodobacteraceae bacterium RKSG542]|uniref:phosphoserine phosphatase SerB n=1 Tax=Pseudovibrio flavus TaxID=2529854 RepID=UPI0012BD445D|nr:phosphoserine phosphatase SerB [Pseudovibrio flavus]MTI19184.1 phosphoserine phosphatase SerB [Pseudovibrio flavus]
MSFVVTLVSNPANPAVTDELIEAIAGALPVQAERRDLNPGIACDLTFACEALPTNLQETLREVIADRPVDLCLQPVEGRKKKLLVADMDSTMIGQECIDELAAELGLKEQISAITERAMRGEIEFEPALKERVGLLKGLDASVVDQVIEKRITLTPGGKELIGTMKANGAYAALVSGGFTVFTSRIAAMIGFDENKANILIEEDGKLAGTVAMPILGQQAKRQRLTELMEEQGLATSETLAVGDGANDLAMIDLSGLGVAYHAKPKVAAEADVRIDHADLTALLYIQGYSADEFKTVA